MAPKITLLRNIRSNYRIKSVKKPFGWHRKSRPQPGFDSRTIQHIASLHRLHHSSHHFQLYRNQNLASYLTLNTNPNIKKKDGYKILIVAKGSSKYTKNSIGIAPEWSWYLMYLILHHMTMKLFMFFCNYFIFCLL
jgi:hypothetical protein